MWRIFHASAETLEIIVMENLALTGDYSRKEQYALRTRSPEVLHICPASLLESE